MQNAGRIFASIGGALRIACVATPIWAFLTIGTTSPAAAQEAARHRMRGIARLHGCEFAIKTDAEATTATVLVPLEAGEVTNP